MLQVTLTFLLAAGRGAALLALLLLLGAKALRRAPGHVPLAAHAGGAAQGGVGGVEAADTRSGAAEPELLLWHHFSLRAYLPGLPMRWRLLLGLFPLIVVARPSNDASVGLQGWRSGLLRRWELCFPVLNVFDTPGQREAGFVEWPLFDIFKVDLRGLTSWADYLAALGRTDRRNVRQRTKFFAAFLADGRLQLQVVKLGPAVFAAVPAAADNGITPPNAAPEAVQSLSASAAGDAALRNGAPRSASSPAPHQYTHQPTTPAALVSSVMPGRAPCTAPQPQPQSPTERWHSSRTQWAGKVPKLGPPQAEPSAAMPGGGGPGGATGNGTASSDSARRACAPGFPLPCGEGADGDGDGEAAPPLPVSVVPTSVAEAEALLARLWPLYERTGARNGFVEFDRAAFERLAREAPGIQAIVVREGGGTALDSIIAFGLALPQRESLQLLSAGLEYDNPLVRQSNSYFKIMFTTIQLALEHNRQQRSQEAQRQGANDSAAAVEVEGGGGTVGGSPCGSSSTCSKGIGSCGDAPAAKPGAADGCMALAAAGTPPPPPHAAVGLIAWVDLGPGHRFVKEHLGAVGHPLSLYMRGIGPISRHLTKRLLSRYFSAAALLNDP